jgi:hypothetical protein
MNRLLLLLLQVPLCYGFSPLQNLVVSRGILSGLRQGVYSELSLQSNFIGLATQVKDYQSTHPWILNAAISLALWGLLTISRESPNTRIRAWKKFTLSERLAKIFVLVFLEVITKNIEYAF